MGLEEQEILIYGAGGFGRELLFLSKHANPELKVVGFVDDNSNVQNAGGLPVVNQLPEEAKFVASMSDALARKEIAERFRSQFITFPIIHKQTLIDESNKIGAGSVICEGVRLTVNIVIGKSVILNLNSTIGHDCRIEDYVSIMPGVHLSGKVFIGEGTLLGTGAVVLPGIKIGKWSKIGAGAVVTRDVPDHTTVVGVPARSDY